MLEISEELYYQCSESKAADQLCGYRAADLCLSYELAKSRFSHGAAHIIMITAISSSFSCITITNPQHFAIKLKYASLLA